jgi:hypothetical protein
VPLVGILSDAMTPDTKVQAHLLHRGEDPVFCLKLSWTSGNCTICHCRNEEHIRVNTERRTATRITKDKNIQKVLNEHKTDMEKKEEILAILKEKEESIEAEKDVVLKAGALFAVFLEQNSIVTYHSVTAQYFNELIEVAKKSGEHAQVAELQGKLDEYEEHVCHFRLWRASNLRSRSFMDWSYMVRA